MRGIIVIICLATVLSCKQEAPVEPIKNPVSDFIMADEGATVLTKKLLQNIRTLGAEKGIMFGHQSTTLYGVGWSGDAGRSDIKAVYGSYPALYGWEIGGIETGNAANLDGDDLGLIRTRLIEAFQRGGVNTVTWHASNPVTGGNSWDKTPAVATIIPGGINHDKYKQWLDKLALFFNSLKDDNGREVPILFRLFHEHTGDGFWWGNGNANATDFSRLWQFTVTYLRDIKSVHNLLYVYSPDVVNTQDQYLAFWPGDNFVDVLGIDIYDNSSINYQIRCLQLLRLLNHIGKFKNKPIALTETGLENNTTQPNWWTEKLLNIISRQPVAYVQVWRNSSQYHFFGPYPGCVSESDFKSFAKNKLMLFQNNLPDMYK